MRPLLPTIVIAALLVWATTAPSETVNSPWDAAVPDKPIAEFNEEEPFEWECGIPVGTNWHVGEEFGEFSLICFDRFRYYLSFIPPESLREPFANIDGSMSATLHIDDTPEKKAGLHRRARLAYI